MMSISLKVQEKTIDQIKGRFLINLNHPINEIVFSEFTSVKFNPLFQPFLFFRQFFQPFVNVRAA